MCICIKICKARACESYILKTVPSFVEGGGKCTMHRIAIRFESGPSNQNCPAIAWVGLPSEFA